MTDDWPETRRRQDERAGEGVRVCVLGRIRPAFADWLFENHMEVFFGLGSRFEVEDLGHGAKQFTLPAAVVEDFGRWLDGRKLHLFRMPIDDELPVYGIGVGRLNDEGGPAGMEIPVTTPQDRLA